MLLFPSARVLFFRRERVSGTRPSWLSLRLPPMLLFLAVDVSPTFFSTFAAIDVS